jgi:hypothetical protein
MTFSARIASSLYSRIHICAAASQGNFRENLFGKKGFPKPFPKNPFPKTVMTYGHNEE